MFHQIFNYLPFLNPSNYQFSFPFIQSTENSISTPILPTNTESETNVSQVEENNNYTCQDFYNINSFLPKEYENEEELRDQFSRTNTDFINKIITIYNKDIFPKIEQYLDPSERNQLQKINLFKLGFLLSKIKKIKQQVCKIDKEVFSQVFSELIKQILACVDESKKEIIKHLILSEVKDYYINTCNQHFEYDEWYSLIN